MRRTLFALALAASTLTAGPAGFTEPLLRLLSFPWSEPAIKAGCGWDPNGLCAPAPPPQTKEGAGWDPSGQPAPAPPPQTDEGAGWDPFG